MKTKFFSMGTSARPKSIELCTMLMDFGLAHHGFRPSGRYLAGALGAPRNADFGPISQIGAPWGSWGTFTPLYILYSLLRKKMEGERGEKRAKGLWGNNDRNLVPQSAPNEGFPQPGHTEIPLETKRIGCFSTVGAHALGHMEERHG